MALTTKERVINVLGAPETSQGFEDLITWYIETVESHIKKRTKREVFESVAVAAQGTITMAGIAVADETFVIDSQTFIWKAARANPGEVTIGADALAAVANLVTAITTDLSTVSAVAGEDETVIVTAITRGVAGNSIVFTEAVTNMTVDGAGTLGTTRTGTANTITEYHDGDGRTGYFLTEEFPVTAVTSIHDDNDHPHTYASGYLVNTDDYEWYEDGRVELVSGTFNNDLKNIKIIYTAGYSPVPADLERLATEWTILAFKGRGKLGISSQSAPDGSETMFGQYLTPDLLAILNLYEDKSKGLCS